MADIKKHREDEFTTIIEFAASVNTGDTVQTVLETHVTTLRRDGVYIDATAEFGAAAGTPSGTGVPLDLGEAGTGEQARGLYYGRMKVETVGGDILTETFTIEVTDVGDIDAPVVP